MVAITKEKETKKEVPLINDVVIEFPKDAKVIKLVRKLDEKGRDLILKEELMVTKTDKDGKKERVPVASLAFRYDGKDYLFKRGEKKTVPIGAAQLWIGAHKVDVPLGLKTLASDDVAREQRRVRNRIAWLEAPPLRLVNGIFEKIVNEDLPEDTVRVG